VNQIEGWSKTVDTKTVDACAWASIVVEGWPPALQETDNAKTHAAKHSGEKATAVVAGAREPGQEDK